MSQPINITDAEWEVMRVVWANESATSKMIIDVLEQKMDWKAPTIKTLLGRLVEKGALKTKLDGRRFEYFPAISKTSSIDKVTDELLNRVCKTHEVNIVRNVIEQSTLSQQEIDSLIEQLLKKKENAPQSVACECTPGQCECHKIIEGGC